LLAINDQRFIDRAEIIREKGTNRSQFFRGEVDKYGWVDIGSSFLPSEIIAAFLYAQVENLEKIQFKRVSLWERYYKNFSQFAGDHMISLPVIPPYATNNAHMFYIVCKDLNQRTRIIDHLKTNGVLSVFHYLSLHKSPFYHKKHDERILVESDKYTDCLLRLPMYYELSLTEVDFISNLIEKFLISEKAIIARQLS